MWRNIRSKSTQFRRAFLFQYRALHAAKELKIVRRARPACFPSLASAAGPIKFPFNGCRVVRMLSDVNLPPSDSKLTYSYYHEASSRPYLSDTVGQILDKTVEKYPEREAYVFCEDNSRATFSQLKEEVDRLAAGFLATGMKKGDRVAIWGPNMREWVLTQFAAARVGLVLVAINAAFQVNELEYVLNKAGCKGLVLADEHLTQRYLDMLIEIAPELPRSEPGQLQSERVPDLKIVVTANVKNKKYRGTYSFEGMMFTGGAEERREVQQLQTVCQFDDPIMIQFTSGTTGTPKGATLTHHNVINNVYTLVDSLNFSEYTRLCLPVPLFHTFGMNIGSLATIVHGITAVYPSRSYNSTAVLTAIQNERCTCLYGAPVMFIDMLNNPDFEKFNVSSLEKGLSGGAPCPADVMKQVIDKMHMKGLIIGYGLTETSPALAFTRMDDPIDIRVTTIGKAAANVEIKIIDSDGRVLPINTSGEICARGYNVMLGYWDEEAKTAEVIDPTGWFHSGDLGSMDENGYLRIEGRIKDVVIRGGSNISPTEIEEFLHTHPKIMDVQVVGVPDVRLGEELCAWIRLHSGKEATEEEIKEFCKGKITHYKIPRYIKFVDSFPTTVSGKVKKFVIRQQASEELGL